MHLVPPDLNNLRWAGRRLATIGILVLSIAPMLLAGTRAPIPAGENLADLRRDAARQSAERMQTLPRLGTFPIEKIFHFSMDEGDLKVTTDMAPTTGPVRVQVEGFSGESTLNLRSARGAGRDDVLFIQFRHDDFHRDNDILVTTQVLTGPNYIQIARGVENPQEDLNISLIQNLQTRRLMGMQGQDAIRLYVQGINSQSGQSTVDLKLAAANLAQLMREHPREMAQYVQPIFRDLHQESAVFAVEPAVAWQVFAPQLQPDPKAAAQVARLLPELGAPRAAQRDQASSALRALGAPGALELMRLDRSKLSPEQNTRLDALLAPYRTLTPAEAADLLNSPDFLLNCLNSDQHDIRAAALDRLKKKFPAIQFNLDADPSDRQAAVARLRQSLLPPATQP